MHVIINAHKKSSLGSLERREVMGYNVFMLQ